MSNGSELTPLLLSVRELVEFSCRSGDLFPGSMAGPTSREGIAGHQKLQKSRGKQWQSERKLKQSVEHEGYCVTLQGRVDLLNEQGDEVIVEEIKTTYQPPERIPDGTKQLHWAQAKLYAYLYLLEQQQQFDASSDITPAQPPETGHALVRVSWFDLVANQAHSETQRYEFSTLQAFVEGALTTYLRWYKAVSIRRKALKQSAQTLSFPFKTYRSGQLDFSRQVYRVIRDKRQLLVEAPTGTGKTMSTVFPAIKAMGEEVIEQLVYLTAKGSGRETAEKAFHILARSGLSIDLLIIQAKDKTCPCRASTDEALQRACQSEDGRCSRTIGFFDRLPEAREACLNNQHLTPEVIQDIALQFQLCPFELTLQMVHWSSVVICDVNYVFDPLVRLAAFDQHPARRLLLIDEVHNLPDRAREMYSASLSLKDIRLIAKQLDSAFDLLKKRVNSLARALSALVSDNTLPKGGCMSGPPDSIDRAIDRVLEVVASTSEQVFNPGLASSGLGQLPDNFSEWLKQLFRYQCVRQLYSTAHVTLLEVKPQGRNREVILKLLCLDASDSLSEKYRSARSTVAFSATLNPMLFYFRLLGLKDQSPAMSLPAVFPESHQLTLRCDYIDTRWQQRGGSMPTLIELIYLVYQHRPGKYMVFFPSYQYLHDTLEQFQQAYPAVEVVQQIQGSDQTSREAFLEVFFKSSGSALGFAILGGVFGEGVDYVGDALTGAIVIGTGMPQPTDERKLIQQHFEQQGLNGYQYAYQYPGFTRVQQTAGRVIRSETNKGVVVLVDPRFARADYQRLMPEQWLVQGCKSEKEVELQLTEFWA